MTKNTNLNIEKIISEVFDDYDSRAHTNESINHIQSSTYYEKPDENDGFIEIRDNQFFIQDARQGGRQPIIIPNPKIQLMINGVVVNENTIVYEKDTITWKYNRGKIFNIWVSEDRLSILLQLNAELHIKAQLKKQNRTIKMQPEIEFVHVHEDIQPLSIQIIEEIRNLGVKIDINHTVLLDELNSPTYKPIAIVEGVAPIDGIDGYIEYFFKLEPENVFEEKNGKIDFKNSYKIPSVKIGTVIGKVHPAIDGKTGIDVFGNELFPTQAKHVEVLTKKRVTINENGEIIALDSGRPSVTGNLKKYIDILKEHIVYGNLDAKTGNIFFNGDVIIHGNVEENLRIESTGTVTVNGNVYSSDIISSQDIIINGTVINSKIYAGQHGFFASEMVRISQSLCNYLKNLKIALNQLIIVLKNKNTDYKIGSIIFMLLEKKFPEIHEEIRKYDSLYKEMQNSNIQIPSDFSALFNLIEPFLTNVRIQHINNIQVIDRLIEAIDEILTKTSSKIQEDSQITLYSASKSTIKTNGSITISRQGTLNCIIYAGSSCIYSNTLSSVRGGKIEAHDEITIAGIVGTPAGNPPTLMTNGKISIAKLIHVKVYVSGQKFLYDKPLDNVKIYYSKNDDKVICNF